ncbi:MAG: PVC-type heme-binding CxxCH protein [Verrucomicrobiota bacterium]
MSSMPGPMPFRFHPAASLFLAVFMFAPTAGASSLKLQKNDQVIWIGNTFAERMQYFGEIESRLHARYPEHNLVVRNLGWSADTVSRRPRPKDFGDLHHYLSEAKADVILACYGFNETWDYDGDAGIDRFKGDLVSLLKDLKGKKYNGRSSPRIVLYSPLACEGTTVPDTASRNRLLQRYTKTMENAAASIGIPFVDLYTASQALYARNRNATHTINGIHLTADGYTELAPSILPDHLFATLPNGAPLDAIRAEVLEKNDTFFDWYRTVNSFYIHGDRKRPYGTVNFPLERRKLLEMTRIRDQRIWKAARGETLPPELDDASTVEIPATFPGKRGGTSPALSPAEERARFEVAEGFRVELFASEEEFPELRNPVAINFDAAGRLWVATRPSYPHALPGVKPNDRILIFEDADQDGKADKRTIFAENLYLPLGFAFGKNGVYVSQEPNLVFLEDTDHDSVADRETIVLHGFGSEDCHHAIHNFVWGPGGGLYMQESVFHHTQVETIHGPRRSTDNAVFRFDPRTHHLDIVSRLPPGGNPWGYAINRWGEHLYVARHHNASLINQPESGNVANARYGNRDNRNCGQEFISSRHWPDEFQGKVFSNQYKNFQGVLLHDWTDDGTTFKHGRLGQVFEAHNKACIPVDLQLGPEGALYVADWYNPVLGHMQYSLRDERRDSSKGRIWRVTWKDRPLDTPAVIVGASTEELLDLLKAYENRTRYRARRALWDLPDKTLRPALAKWVAALDPSEPDQAHHLTEALWLHQQRGWINAELFRWVSSHSDHRARAAAAHLLRYWSEDLPGAHAHFQRLANDRHPKVRLETVASSTWADPSIAVAVLDLVSEGPQDSYLKFALSNARKALGPALEHHPMAIPVEKLASLSLTEGVLKALIRRPGLDASHRFRALDHLAKREDGRSREEALVEVIQELDRREGPALDDWLAMLDDITISFIEPIARLLKSENPSVRQAAFAAQVRSGHLTEVPADADALRSISRIKTPGLKGAYFQPARRVLQSSAPAIQEAALFCLGRVPGNNALIVDLLAQHMARPGLNAAAAEALLARPEKAWATERAGALLAAHLPILEATPVAQRGSASFRQSATLLNAIATIRNATDSLERIHDLQLVPFKITTVPDQLRYRETSLRVPANTPIELRLENPDSVQHNLVLCAPGSLEKVGHAVDRMLADPKAVARDWIPDLPEVLHATPMAGAHENVVLRFRTPKVPGSYPFLCTVPGHWRVMQGTMVVGDAGASATEPKDCRILVLTGEPEYGTHTSLSELAKSLQGDHPLEFTHLELSRSTTPHRFPELNKHLSQADLLILSIRFANLETSQYKALDQYLAEKPFIAIRTSTHLFQFPKDSKLAPENRAFPDRHFGTPYRGHHGHDSSQVNYVMAAKHPVVTGMAPRFWTPDFHYAVNPLSLECTPLMIGQAIEGRQPATFKNVGGHNHAMVLSAKDDKRLRGSPHPLVWTVNNKEGRRAVVTTIGARKSFEDENVRRLYRNAVLWCLERKVPKTF